MVHQQQVKYCLFFLFFLICFIKIIKIIIFKGVTTCSVCGDTNCKICLDASSATSCLECKVTFYMCFAVTGNRVKASNHTG